MEIFVLVQMWRVQYVVALLQLHSSLKCLVPCDAKQIHIINVHFVVIIIILIDQKIGFAAMKIISKSPYAGMGRMIVSVLGY